jgi:hypothetical protein
MRSFILSGAEHVALPVSFDCAGLAQHDHAHVIGGRCGKIRIAL